MPLRPREDTVSRRPVRRLDAPSAQVMVALMRATAPLLIALSVWWPAFTHFRIDRTAAAPGIVNQLTRGPPAEVLGQVAAIEFLSALGTPPSRRTHVAALILRGQVEAPDFFTEPQALRGWPDDLKPGAPTYRLAVASLALEDLLLGAFERSGERPYYELARERVLAFARWEARQREPYESVWNDHAIAARISVLIRLWRWLRDDAQTTPEQRVDLINLVTRSAELLAKASQFTVRTNHGVMQNLALLQITAAFPGLPKARDWRGLAMDRLALQLGFFVSDEGAILEHSAQYQVFGERLIADALCLARLNGLPPPQRLHAARAATEGFTQRLWRPDGSLPQVGSTARGQHALSFPDSLARASVPSFGSAIYPLSGYAVWWASEGTPSQTLVVWAKHDGHGHKHADEPSVHFWSRGIDWVTATGYWPYGQRDHEQANGWPGSNAPHAQGEAPDNARTVQLHGSGQAGGMRAIDVGNARRDGLTVRRQIVQLASEQLLVLDSIRGATGPIETIWTLDPRLTLHAAGTSQFRSSPAQEGPALQINLAHETGASIHATRHHGSRAPFAGWVVIGRAPVAAPALRLERRAGDSLTAVLLTVNNRLAPTLMSLADGSQPEAWAIDIADPSGSWRVQRRGAAVELSGPQGTTRLNLAAAPPDLSERQQALRSAMIQAVQRFPPWRELDRYRQRIYLGIAVLWLAGELVRVGLVRKGWRPAWMDGVMLAGWGSAAWWIHAHYLV